MLQRLTLPPWMRPVVIVPLEHLPLNLHGKINRRAIAGLPVARSAGGSGDNAVNGPEGALTESQEKMVRVWEHVLGASGVLSAAPSPTTEFFRIGGTSLQLIQIQSEVRRRFALQVPVVDLFKNNSLAAMAAIVFGDDRPAGTGQKRSAEMDWDQETSLPGTLMATEHGSTAVEPKQPPRVVLLTGATGFVGKALLAALIARDSVDKIHCVAVRDPSKLGTWQRHPKLTVHSGDLADPSLSLTLEDQKHLARTVDLVIHNGADVSFLKPYTSLREPNVFSTRFLVSLAAPRRIPIHYISSASVGRLLLQASQDGNTKLPAVSLAHSPPGAEWADGYTASKWASEALLEHAAISHLAVPVVVHRLSSVTANNSVSTANNNSDSLTQATDVIGSVVNYSLHLRAVPDPAMAGWRGALDFVSVGRAADGVVASAFISEPSSNGIPAKQAIKFLFQSSEQIVPVERIAAYVAGRLGIKDSAVKVLPMDKWLALARKAGMEELVAVFLEESQRRTGGAGIVFQELLSS